MESLGLQCGKAVPFTSSGRWVDEQSRINCYPHHQLSMKKLMSPINMLKITRVCATTTAAVAATPSPVSSSLSSSCSWDQQQMPPEKLDEWITDSVSEIVKNIGGAPFLVHVYSPTSNKTETRLELEREKVMGDSWSSITRRWREGCPIPDGVILVEQLGQKNQLKPVDDNQGDGAVDAATGTREWGVLIQGRGIDTAACYILKTCRVGSSLGFCTHFCLVKAKCFGETAELQFQNCWNGINN